MTEYKIVDPATNVLVRRYPTSDDATVDRAVEAAAAEFTAWRRRPVKERADAVLAVSREFENRREELAAIITREMGKTTREALGEVDLSAAIFAYYAEHGPDFAADQRLDIRGGDDVVVRSEPLGVLLGVMPWNYPYYQVARFAAPNLVLGNTVVLKHAPNCPESAQAIEDIMRAAGLPTGAYINVYATNEQVARVIADPRVQGVSLTGSERAGRAVGEVAGRHLKKYVLELGGSDPFVVLPDADLEAAVAAAVEGRMGNAGQACTASKRFIVVDPLYDRFLGAFTDTVRALTVGDPTDDGVSFGPLSSEEAARAVIAQVNDAVERGATAVTGASGRPARVPSSNRPSSPGSPPACGRTRRRSSARSRSSTASPTPRRRSASPTTPRTASAASCSAATSPPRRRSPTRSTSAWSRSTAPPRPRRTSPSAGSSCPAWGGSWGRTEWRSS